MNKKQLTANLLLLITAFIWGVAFVSQRVGAEYVGAFTFNGVRFALGCVALLPLYLALNVKKDVKYTPKKIRNDIKGGIICGTVMFIASSLQQIGVTYTTAGKAGFITGLYVALVPVFALIFLKRKSPATIWIGMIFAAIGLYLLCVEEGFSIAMGDIIVFIGSFFWAGHILVIDKFANEVDAIELSIIQFATCGMLSLIVALIFEPITAKGVTQAAIPILYGGVCSVGIAYTLQVIGQKHAKPAHAAIILSLESVFSVLAGVVILHEKLAPRGIIGCVCIFAALIISQTDFSKMLKRKKAQ